MNFLGNILYDSVYHSAPIILCVLGGIFAYNANVLNIALEGMMLNGAFMSLLLVHQTGSVVIGIAGALLTTLLLGLVFSFMSVTCKGNVIIVGLAVNMLVSAVAGFALQLMQTSNINLTAVNVADFKINIPIIGGIPLLGNLLSGHPPITYLSFLAILLMWLLMYKTKFGIYVRVVGENEDAAKSIGLKTEFYKYCAILIGAFCCALAGVNLALERMALFTNDMTAGRGFIAIAAIYCGRGAPVASSLYAIVFGIARALAVNLGLFAGPTAGLFDVIPYVIMAAVLTVVSMVKRKNNRVRSFQ